MKNTISKTWEHQNREDDIYKRWETNGYFRPEYKRKATSTPLRQGSEGQAVENTVDTDRSGLITNAKFQMPNEMSNAKT